MEISSSMQNEIQFVQFHAVCFDRYLENKDYLALEASEIDSRKSQRLCNAKDLDSIER